MPIWIQLTIVGVIVVAAILHLARTLWRWLRRPAGDCGGNCGCDAASKAPTSKRVGLTINATSKAPRA